MPVRVGGWRCRRRGIVTRGHRGAAQTAHHVPSSHWKAAPDSRILQTGPGERRAWVRSQGVPSEGDLAEVTKLVRAVTYKCNFFLKPYSSSIIAEPIDDFLFSNLTFKCSLSIKFLIFKFSISIKSLETTMVTNFRTK